MSEATDKFTREPWKLGRTEEGKRLILGSNGHYVASIQIYQTPRTSLLDEEERLANVSLMLAAPLLYRALEAVVNCAANDDSNAWDLAYSALAAAREPTR